MWRLIVLLWACESIFVSASAQTLDSTGGLLPGEVPQAISPTAMEMGRYGKHPVSYYTGVPQISIPLTELRAKGRALPVYLTYHAGGNKPDMHPGWVGLSWTLHCGGSITRVVNNMKDETTLAENASTANHPGYFWNASEFQATDWADSEMLTRNRKWKDHYRLYDTEPDEFQISVEGLHASFFFVSQNEIRIKSKSAASFKVAYELGDGDFELISTGTSALRAPSYCYFKSFTITNSDGTVYHFGGDDSSIEYSVRCKPNPNHNAALSNEDYFIGGATVNTWLLTRIDYPDGESILFTYEKDGTPVQRIDSDYLIRCRGTLPEDVINEDSSTDRTTYPNVSFQMMRPSYLRSVSCVISGDHLSFGRAETVELKQVLPENELIERTYATAGTTFDPSSRASMRQADKYYKLTSISGIRDSIIFSYTNSTSERLKLLSVDFRGSDGADCCKYEMHYNPLSLPAYGAKQTDRWGFYNGKSYENVAWTLMNEFRSVDTTKVKAEILTRLDYPAGGYTEFFYESNTYSRIQGQYPGFPMESLSADCLGGGLRIRQVKDHDGTGVNVTSRRFEYKLANGRSSGVSSGHPSFYEETSADVPYAKYYSSGIFGFFESAVIDTLHLDYFIGSETSSRPLSTTDGANITYDRVTEVFADGGKTILEYSNHGTPGCSDRQSAEALGTINGRPLAYPFTSMELSRGHLLSKKVYDNTGTLKQEESFTYQQDTLQFVKSFGQRMYSNGLIYNMAYTKEFTFWPALKTKTVTVYPDDGGTPVVETSTYSYNEDRLPVRESRLRGNNTDVVRIHYSSDIPEMAALSLNNRLTGKEESRNGLLTSAIKQDYRQVTGSETFVPWHYYQAVLSTPIDTASYYPFQSSYFTEPDITVTKADSLGNILETLGRDGVYTTYTWTPDGVSLSGIARNARNSRENQSGAVQQTEEGELSYMISEGPGIPVDSFYLGSDGYVTFYFDSSYGQDWGVTLSVDGTGGGTVRLGSHGIEENAYNSVSGYNNTSDHATLLLGSGWHNICVTETLSVITEEGEQSEEPMLTYEAGWTEYVVTSSGYDGFLYDDLGEENLPGTYSFSFHPDPDVDYILDYRVQRNGELVYVRQQLGTSANDTYTINEGQNKIATVRVYPASASVTTYTYRPNIGVTSVTDSRGVTEFYEYDSLGRLIAVNDNEGNPIQTYTYHYATETTSN